MLLKCVAKGFNSLLHSLNNSSLIKFLWTSTLNGNLICKRGKSLPCYQSDRAQNHFSFNVCFRLCYIPTKNETQ